MSLIEQARGAAEAVVPPLRLERGAAYVIAGLIALGLAWALFWWLFLRPIEDRTRAEQGKVDSKLANATGDIAAKSIPIITETERRRVEIDVAVQKGTINVRQAADAAAPIAGVSDAVRRGNCLLPALYHADSACVAVRADREGIGPPGPDAGSAAGTD